MTKYHAGRVAKPDIFRSVVNLSLGNSKRKAKVVIELHQNAKNKNKKNDGGPVRS